MSKANYDSPTTEECCIWHIIFSLGKALKRRIKQTYNYITKMYNEDRHSYTEQHDNTDNSTYQQSLSLGSETPAPMTINFYLSFQC